MSTPEPPGFGPCTPWITGEDVAAVCDVLDTSGDPAAYDDVALEASQILWAASGRQFSGICGPVTDRPCVPNCGCWPLGTYDGFTWNMGGFWISGGGGGIAAVQGWVGGGGGCYTNACCGFLSRVKLAGYPVVQIDEVLIDGVIIDPANYRLDQWKFLTYLDDASGNPQRWPACQNLAAPETEVGTFAVTYTHGIAPPLIGLDAALELACHLARADADCGLPAGTTQYTRQGVQVELAPRIKGELPPGYAALPLVQAFLSTVNPNGLNRRSAFWSPDVTQYAQRVGQ